jgi:hypothetical protein
LIGVALIDDDALVSVDRSFTSECDIITRYRWSWKNTTT